jgi:hypothetical protein
LFSAVFRTDNHALDQFLDDLAFLGFQPGDGLELKFKAIIRYPLIFR